MKKRSWKKLTAAIVSSVVITVGSYYGLPEEVSLKLAGIAVAYILGQGLADVGKEKAKVENGG